VIWRQIGVWTLLATLVSTPGIKQLADTAYNRFADYRFARLGHCQIAANGAPPRKGTS